MHRGLVYIDLNMLRARMFTHPSDWTHAGYREIQNPPKRYGIIDLWELRSLCGFSGVTDFQQGHRRSDCRGIRTRELPNSFVERFELSEAIERPERFEPTRCCSEAVALGNSNFVQNVKSELGLKAAHREVIFRFQR